MARAGSLRRRTPSAFAPRRRGHSPVSPPRITIATAGSICISAPTFTFRARPNTAIRRHITTRRTGRPIFSSAIVWISDPPCFEDVTAATGMDHNNNRFSFAGAWCDYNGDGWPDLYVANDFGRKNLYRNTNGPFPRCGGRGRRGGPGAGDERGVVRLRWRRASRLAGVEHVERLRPAHRQRSGVRSGEADPALREAYRRHVKGNSLYHNNGDGTFTYTGDSQGIEMGHWSWSCDGCDFDNDGTPEIYIACGMLTNNSRTDLMSYFYRQVVAKSPVNYDAAPRLRERLERHQQFVRARLQLGGSGTERVLRAPRRTLLRFLRRQRHRPGARTAALSR